MKRTAPKRSRKRIRPRSAKREAIVRDRAALVVKVLVARPRCEFREQDSRCSRQSTDVHEPLTRARGGSILDESNTLALCSLHHSWVHDHPKEATKLGLLISQFSASRSVPAVPTSTPRLAAGAEQEAAGREGRE